jgi:hypothetical protein
MSSPELETTSELEIPAFEEDPNKEYIDNSTVLMRVEDKMYPLNFQQIRRMVENVIFAPKPDTEFMESIGYVVVHESTPPVGQVVTEVTPELGEDGKWYRAYTARDYSPEEAQAAFEAERQTRLQLLEIRLNERLAIGYEFTPPGASAVQHLALTDIDALDLGTTLRNAQSALDRNRPTTFRVRTVEKQTLTLSAQDAVDIITEAMDERQRIQGLSWDLEDLLNLAETPEELPEIPARLD